MSDYIDRQAAIDIVRFECGEWRGLAKTIENGLSDLPSAGQYKDYEIQRMQDIEQAQIEKAYDLGYAEGKADAVPVVRCKDCKHWDGHYCHNQWWGDGYAHYTPPIKTEDGYCDWAERKEE